jgi:outer membrane murein-binding lipoprotein Lpp
MKTKMRVVTALLVAVIVGPFALSGCVSTSEIDNVPDANSGRQATDLEQAYKNGDINREQYRSVKKKLSAP